MDIRISFRKERYKNRIIECGTLIYIHTTSSVVIAGIYYTSEVIRRGLQQGFLLITSMIIKP